MSTRPNSNKKQSNKNIYK